MHGKERQDKNCLNCGAEVAGHYCQHCGQANVELEDTVWGMISHFIADIFHYDGKFFHTMRLLLLKPAFLTKEYLRGRRSAYLHPVKMYVFTSAICFILFFFLKDHPPSSLMKNAGQLVQTEAGVATQDSILQNEETSIPAAPWKRSLTEKFTQEYIALTDSIARITDSTDRARLQQKLDELEKGIISMELRTGIPIVTVIPDSSRSKWPVADIRTPQKSNILPGNLASYDSTQKSLPETKRDGWFIRYGKKKIYLIRDRMNEDPDKYLKEILDDFLHSLPKMMFISLPFVAFFIYLLYYRHKRRNYVGLGIFTIHNYIAMYIILLTWLLLSYLILILPSWFVFPILWALAIYALWYNYSSLRNFFHQPAFKTIIKFLVLLFLTGFLFVLLTGMFASWMAISSV